jgi:histidinol-phosphate aminotransferase
MAPRLRDDLSTLIPYAPGLNAAEVAARFGIAADHVVKLGSGENPYGPSPAAVEAIRRIADQLHQYPEWTARRLREAVAQHVGTTPEQVVCGAGETELISAVIRAFADAGDEVLMHETTFPVYHLYAEAEGRRPVYADGGGAAVLAVTDLLDRLTERTRVVFLTSPHNPSGRRVTSADIRGVCTAAAHALVVVDEAYIHFAEHPSVVSMLAEYDNLLVLRTFSKAYGLAGLRVGFGIGSPSIIEALMRIKPTWNLGPLQVAGAIAALGDDEHVTRTTELVKATRAKVVPQIDRLDGVSVTPGSQANFVLVRIDRHDVTSAELFARLARRGLVVKDCALSYRGLADRHLRIDIGTEDTMHRLVAALTEALT